MKAFTVAISGPSGSGKSSLAKAIADYYEDQVVYLAEDRYCKDRSEIKALKRRLQINFDLPQAIDHQRYRKDILALQQNNSITAPIYDFQNARGSKLTEVLTTKPIILLEGLFVLTQKRLRELIDCSIYVDTALDLCLYRRLYRDLTDRKLPMSYTLTNYLKIRNGWQNHIDKSKKHADLIINNNENLQLTLRSIIKFIDNNLISIVNKLQAVKK